MEKKKTHSLQKYQNGAGKCLREKYIQSQCHVMTVLVKKMNPAHFSDLKDEWVEQWPTFKASVIR